MNFLLLVQSLFTAFLHHNFRCTSHDIFAQSRSLQKGCQAKLSPVLHVHSISHCGFCSTGGHWNEMKSPFLLKLLFVHDESTKCHILNFWSHNSDSHICVSWTVDFYVNFEYMEAVSLFPFLQNVYIKNFRFLVIVQLLVFCICCLNFVLISTALDSSFTIFKNIFQCYYFIKIYFT